jgi:hypothetical protein
MIMTVIEGRVAQDQWKVIWEAFQKAIEDPPPQIYQSFLTHSDDDQEFWRLTTVWDATREEVEEMWKDKTPVGVLMFREAGVEPQRTFFHIAGHLAGTLSHSA